jgi:hypothetical protein
MLLSGCGVVQQKQMQGEMQSIKAYCDGLKQDPALDVIRNKRSLDKPEKPTFEMLTLNEKPTEQDKQAIKRFAEIKAACMDKFDAFLDSRGFTNYKTIIDSYAAIADGLNVELYDGKYTYAEFNKLIRNNAIEMQSAIVNEDEKVMSRRAQAAQQAYQNYMTYQQTQNQNRIINNMNKPITCNKVGNYTYCN